MKPVSDGTRCTGGAGWTPMPGSRAPARIPFPAHLSAPAAVSLTARLGSSSSGPGRRTASRRARAPAAAAPARPARRRTRGPRRSGAEAAGQSSGQGDSKAHAQGRGGRGARHGWGPLRAACSPPVPARPRRALASLFPAVPPLARRPPPGSVPVAAAASA